MSDKKIVVEGVKKSFPSNNASLPVIAGVSFSVADGEFVAMVGPSGCGKSTLMNIIAGFDKPDEGSARVDGAVLAGPSPKGIVISQHGSVFPWLTVQENLMFGLTDRHGANATRRSVSGNDRDRSGTGAGRCPPVCRRNRRHCRVPADG